jgi:hypothetical protein
MAALVQATTDWLANPQLSLGERLDLMAAELSGILARF